MATREDSPDLVLKALADPTRREMLELLASGPLAVGELAERFPVSRPAISKHLRLLEEAGLVVPRHEGRKRLCVFDPVPLARVRRWLDALEAGGGGDLGAASDAAERLRPVIASPAPPRRPLGKAQEPEDDWRCW